MVTVKLMNDSGKRIDYGEGAAIREPSDGKGRPDLISPWALTRLAKWYELGAIKYGDDNWRKGMPFKRYTASLFRHLIAWMKKDNEEDHLAAIAWNAFAMMHHQELGEDEKWDDIPSIHKEEKFRDPKVNQFLGQRAKRRERRVKLTRRKLKILVDLDDVLNNLLERWVDELNLRHGMNVKVNSITDWDICFAYPALTQKQVYGVIHEEDFWKTLKPMKDAPRVLSELIADGHSIRIVTATDYDVVSVKMEWLFKFFPYLNWNMVIIAQDKQSVQGDVLIDDAVHNLTGGSYEKILFSAPHNQNYNAEANETYRAHNWSEVYEIINNIYEEKHYAASRSV